MNKKVFMLLLVVVVVAGFVLGFATAKKSDAEDVTTTLPLVDVNDETETKDFDDEGIETDTETAYETETETTEAEEELKSDIIETDYFILETPAEWYGEYSYKTKKQNDDGSYQLVFTHPETEKLTSSKLDATIFIIDVFPKKGNEKLEGVSNAKEKGILTVDGEEFYVVLAPVSDVRYIEETAESYTKILNGADEFMESLKPVNGVEYEPYGAKG
jgi:hypothetical protein